MRPGSRIEDYVELAKAWRQHLCSGQAEALDWLTTRTCTVDLRGSTSDVEPLDREALVGFARALGEGLTDVTWDVDRILQREHQVVVDAQVEARHTGPLDFSPIGGPKLEGGEGRLVLPRQRFSWHVVHKRIHEFEVLEGPGLGWDVIAEALDLKPHASRPSRDRAVEDPAAALRDTDPADRAAQAGNGNGSETNGSNGHATNGGHANGDGARDEPTPSAASTTIAGLSDPISTNGHADEQASEPADADEEEPEEHPRPSEGSLEAKVDRVIEEKLD